jgi:hypothetical protein
MARNVAETAAEVLGDISAILRTIEQGDLPRALGEVEGRLNERGTDGREFITGVLRLTLRDSGHDGEIYRLMTSLPVPLFLTTNYDGVFERHLKSHGYAVSVHTKMRESLEEIDPGSYDHTFVHVHGFLDHGGELIITDHDYFRIHSSDEFEPLRLMIEAHLVRSPVVVMGYSLGDPDLLSIAQNVARIVRRTHPVVRFWQTRIARRRPGSLPSTTLKSSRIAQMRTKASWLVHYLSWSSCLRSPKLAWRPRRTKCDCPRPYTCSMPRQAGTFAVMIALKSLILSALVDVPDGVPAGSLESLLEDRAGVKRQDNLARASACPWLPPSPSFMLPGMTS